MKIQKWLQFINEAVTVPQVITDLVSFLEESPVITLYPEDVEGVEVREGWLTREHKLYSIPAIKKFFKEKYGEEYSSLSVDNAILFEPNRKALEKLLKSKGLTLQWTELKGQYGDSSWFFSVNLSETELKTIKEMYEMEFKKRYSKYYLRKSGKLKSSKTSTKKNEALQILFEALFNL
jgi:hypothetical protein